MKRMILGAVIAASLAAPAAALTPLSQEKYINDRLIAARVADKIRRNCKSIDGRIVYAWSQARALKKYARNKGYSEAQIKAFLDSKPDKARIYAAAAAYLRKKGATNAAGYCKLGRSEIARGSIAGSLLKEK